MYWVTLRMIIQGSLNVPDYTGRVDLTERNMGVTVSMVLEM